MGVHTAETQWQCSRKGAGIFHEVMEMTELGVRLFGNEVLFALLFSLTFPDMMHVPHACMLALPMND